MSQYTKGYVAACAKRPELPRRECRGMNDLVPQHARYGEEYVEAFREAC